MVSFRSSSCLAFPRHSVPLTTTSLNCLLSQLQANSGFSGFTYVALFLPLLCLHLRLASDLKSLCPFLLCFIPTLGQRHYHLPTWRHEAICLDTSFYSTLSMFIFTKSHHSTSSHSSCLLHYLCPLFQSFSFLMCNEETPNRYSCSECLPTSRKLHMAVREIFEKYKHDHVRTPVKPLNNPDWPWLTVWTPWSGLLGSWQRNPAVLCWLASSLPTIYPALQALRRTWHSPKAMPPVSAAHDPFMRSTLLTLLPGPAQISPSLAESLSSPKKGWT